MNKIKIAIVGIDNRASTLIREINYYIDKKPGDAIGYIYWKIGGYKLGDIEVVAAFDIDGRKVGKDMNEVISSGPDCATAFPFHRNLPDAGVSVQMGKILDGYSGHTKDYNSKEGIILADCPEPTRDVVVNILKETGAEVIMNYLPSGAEIASKFYAYCALEAGVSFVNNTPALIASNPLWAFKFEYKNVPIIGDEIKAEFSDPGVHTSSINSIRCAKLALDRGQGGVLLAPSAYFCKYTAHRITDDKACDMIMKFIKAGDVYSNEIPYYHSGNKQLYMENMMEQKRF